MIIFRIFVSFSSTSCPLLKNLLCWSFRDIVYLKFKVRSDESKTEINKDLALRIEHWNKADTKMYTFFNRTFWRKVNAFGLQRMQQELATFERIKNEIEEECIDGYEPLKQKPWVLHAKLKHPLTDACKKLSMSELTYSEYLRERQIARNTRGPQLSRDGVDMKLFEEVQRSGLRSF